MHPWSLGFALWRLQLDALALATTAPLVVAHRLLWAGRHWHEPDFVADPEWRRMVREKVEAALESNRHATRWWREAIDHPFDLARTVTATRRSLHPYVRRVRRNAERLGA
jgi:hypothetical protein